MKRVIILSFVCMTLAAAAMAQSQQDKNKIIVERYLKAYMECDLNTIAETVSKEVKMYLFGEFWLDYEGLIEVTKEKKGTAEKVTYEEWVTEGNKVVAKWTSIYKNGVYRGMTLGVIEDGKIIEWYAYFKKTGEPGEME
ncbi:MAG: nuclear transport factor 2 family protein [Candidatus Atribacteria bacterium]|nr:MAG: nuclear transport factor 2 family protein [Candidatus Atribacteria bacterium]